MPYLLSGVKTDTHGNNLSSYQPWIIWCCAKRSGDDLNVPSECHFFDLDSISNCLSDTNAIIRLCLICCLALRLIRTETIFLRTNRELYDVVRKGRAMIWMFHPNAIFLILIVFLIAYQTQMRLFDHSHLCRKVKIVSHQEWLYSDRQYRWFLSFWVLVLPGMFLTTSCANCIAIFFSFAGGSWIRFPWAS